VLNTLPFYNDQKIHHLTKIDQGVHISAIKNSLVSIRQLLSILDQLGKLQPKMIIYQGPIYTKKLILLDQTLICREPTKIGLIFSE